MPEGPTLHRLAKLHQARFAGAPVQVSSPQGKFADAALVDGQVLVKAEAWGKHLMHHYDSGFIVHIHLGLYGGFTELPLPMGVPVGQVRMRMVGAGYGTDLRGATTCELVSKSGRAAILARLGPDPLRRGARPEPAWERISRSRKSIAALLMDQRVVAGIGNVYRAELLFRHGISPERPGMELSRAEWGAMWADLLTMMRKAMRAGKILTIRREHDHGAPPYAKDRPRTYVYRRAGEECRVCGGTVLHRELEGRNLFWCPACQAR